MVAVERPERVLTLTLMSTGAAGERADSRSCPGAEPRIAETFADPLPAPDWSDREAVIDYLVETERPYAGSLGFDEEAARRRNGRVVDRAHDVAAAANHWSLEGDSPTFPMSAISRTHPGDPRLRRPVLPAGARGGARGRDPWRQARHARRGGP